MSSRAFQIPEMLHMMGYSLPAIGEICDHIILNQTVEGCPEFRTDEDRQRVEDMLPDVPESAWERADRAWAPLIVKTRGRTAG